MKKKEYIKFLKMIINTNGNPSTADFKKNNFSFELFLRFAELTKNINNEEIVKIYQNELKKISG